MVKHRIPNPTMGHRVSQPSLNMKSLQRKFNSIKEKNQYWSDLICFNETVSRANYTHRTISMWFKKLVEKEDYENIDKDILIEQAYKLSNSIVF